MAAKSKRIDGRQKPPVAAGRIRGVTRPQYLALSRMVKAGETTWEELERRGIVLPARRISEFRQSVRKALKK